jgi:hypothetical protein
MTLMATTHSSRSASRPGSPTHRSSDFRSGQGSDAHLRRMTESAQPSSARPRPRPRPRARRQIVRARACSPRCVRRSLFLFLWVFWSPPLAQIRRCPSIERRHLGSSIHRRRQYGDSISNGFNIKCRRRSSIEPPMAQIWIGADSPGHRVTRQVRTGGPRRAMGRGPAPRPVRTAGRTAAWSAAVGRG